MKTKHIFTASVMVILGIITKANAVPFEVYTNGVTVRNIIAMQHSISTNTIQTFEGTMAAALGNRAHFDLLPDPNYSTAEYGRMSQYGQMPIYGEYNDDGTAFSNGRSGGDTQFPTINSLWANWQHFDDGVKFHGFNKIDTDYDLVTVGLAGSHTQLGSGISQWGIFGGYAGGKENNKSLNLKEHGGYVGIYSGYNIYNINLSATINAGAMFSDSDFRNETMDYSNVWTGATFHAAYNIAIDNTLTLQPSLYAGITWVKSDNYMLGTNNVNNDNLTALELTPEIRAIKHIGSGWFGTANVRYVATHETGSKTTVNNMHVKDLDCDNYAEYGISLEKSIDRFNITLHVGRRDGGRNGWNGGTSFKYIF